MEEHRLPQEKINQVLELLQQGCTLTDTVLQTGVARTTIYKMRKDGRLPKDIVVIKKRKPRKRKEKTCKEYIMPPEEIIKLYGKPGICKTKKPLIISFSSKHQEDNDSIACAQLDRSFEKQLQQNRKEE